MNRFPWRTCSWCISGAASCATALSASGQSITNLGTLSGFSAAYDVSDDGSVVVGESGNRAFRWSSGTMQDLGTMGGPFSGALAVSANGLVAAGYAMNSGTFTRAARWSSGVISDLGTLGANPTSAQCVSGDGLVVAGMGYLPNGNFMAFRWTSTEGMQDLGVPMTHALGMSHDGTTVVGYHRLGNGDRAFRWTTSEGLRYLDLTVSSSASDCSGDGSVIVGSFISSGSTRAFLWTQGGGMQTLGVLAGHWMSGASAVSDDGSTVVGNSILDGNHPASTSHAFLWRAGSGMTSLSQSLIDLGVDLSGWTVLRSAQGVSADGRYVVGYGVHNGLDRAFLADLGPRGGSTCPADLLVDGEVDGKDLAVLLSAWGLINTPANIDRSSSSPTVDGQDLAVLLASWGACQ